MTRDDPAQASHVPPAPHDVVVVGAGLAGLAAAVDLATGGRRVTVLDARS
ncbi:MAG: FAD-dependent oxidoreductase, partial [Acidimicrobiales bacterium]